jgi:hypothetical protein
MASQLALGGDRLWSRSPRARFKSAARILLRFLAAFLGVGLLAHLILRTGPELIWKQVHAVGWGLALIILLGGLSQFIKTCAWRQTFTCDISRLSWSRSLGVQLVSDAAGQLGFAGKVLGEGFRVSLVTSAVPLPSGIAASVIDGGLHTLTAAIVTVLGIAATLLVADIPGKWRVDAFAVAIVLVIVVILAGVSVARRVPLMGNAVRVIARVPVLHDWLSAKAPVIDSAEQDLLTFYRVAPAAFCKAVVLNVLWHALAVLEVFLVLRFMGAHISGMAAFVAEGFTKVINLVGVLNPGNLGTYEGGNMLIARLLGVPGTAGLTLALCRRARIMFWAAVGAVCMILMKTPSGFGRAAAKE